MLIEFFWFIDYDFYIGFLLLLVFKIFDLNFLGFGGCFGYCRYGSLFFWSI